MYPEDVEKLGQDFERWTKDKIMSNGERVAGFKVAMLNVSGVTALPQVPPACRYHHHHRHHLLLLLLHIHLLHFRLPQFKHPAKLPFLNQLLYAGFLHGTGKYLTYSNIDIAVQPSFYIKIGRQLQIFPDLPISTIREEFEHVSPGFNVETATARRGSGLGHPGHDCWTFPKDWVPRIILGFTMVGVSMVATDLMQARRAATTTPTISTTSTSTTTTTTTSTSASSPPPPPCRPFTRSPAAGCRCSRRR